jgi:RNA polymerase sigma-70 factor, ECF subfamily
MTMDIDAAWRTHHRHLLDVAYRMLGSLSEAEDAAQEAFARLLRADVADIEDVGGWLVVVVSRICLDQLRSARVRREAYIGPWLPEPVLTVDEDAVDPAERVTLDDSVRMALLVVLERLSPAERLAFVLHDVFQYSFETVAAITGRSPAACRQLASRARRHIQNESGAGRFDVDPIAARRAAERFIAAANSGDVDSLLEVLDPEVAGWIDAGGFLPAPRRPAVGRDAVVARLGLWMRADGITFEPATVNGRPGVLALQDGGLLAVLALTFNDGRIIRIHGVANPEKLERAHRQLRR